MTCTYAKAQYEDLDCNSENYQLRLHRPSQWGQARQDSALHLITLDSSQATHITAVKPLEYEDEYRALEQNLNLTM